MFWLKYFDKLKFVVYILLANNHPECFPQWIFVQRDVSINIPIQMLQPNDVLYTFEPTLLILR